MKIRPRNKYILVFILSTLLLLTSLPNLYSVSAAKKYNYGSYQYSISNKQVSIIKYKGTASNLTIPSKIGNYKVVKIGAYAFNDNKHLKSVKMPNTITAIDSCAFFGCNKLSSITLSKNLKTLGESAFESCSSLKSITLPSKTKQLGAYLFNECKNLKSVNLPEGITKLCGTFSNCKNLKNIDLPSTLQILEGETFKNCSNLKSIEIPANVTTLGRCVFTGCRLLTRIELPDEITTIPYQAFQDCTKLSYVNLPANLTTIEAEAFSMCTSLVEIELPEGVTQIGSSAFSYCNQLDKINLPGHLERLGNSTFWGCSSLCDITLPESLTELGQGTFRDCESLTSITIPDGVESLYEMAFQNCKSLSEINLPNTLKLEDYTVFDGCSSLKEITIPDATEIMPHMAGCTSLQSIHVSEKKYYEEDGIIYSKDKTKLIRFIPDNDIDEFTIPDYVTELAPFAFSGASKLTTLTIPDTITSLPRGICAYSPSLETINLTDKIDRIPEEAFCGCSFEEFEIPHSIRYVDFQAFAYNEYLRKLTFYNNLLSISTSGDWDMMSTFEGCTALEEFHIIGKSYTYKVIDQVLFEIAEDGKLRLICYPAQKTNKKYIVPNQVRYISTFAFEHPQYLKKLTLGPDMDYLGSYFLDCNDLAIMVPKNINNFISSEHISDFPIFINCRKCYLYVVNGSTAHKHCKKYNIPYKLWK